MTGKVSTLIDQLDQLQAKEDGRYYNKGLWSSQRYNRLFMFRIEDNNIFVSASIVYLLNQIKAKVTDRDRIKIEAMIDLFMERIEDYKNKDDKATFNFWRTKPSQHFPHGKICSKLDYFRLADDADDTSLIYLIDETRKTDLSEFSSLLSHHANQTVKSIRKIWDKYKDYAAYSTFFGIKMPIEFDVCVQSNILSVFYKYDLPHTEQTDATVELIKACIQDGILLDNPFHIAPNYARSSIIFYHIIRMIYTYEPQAFADVKKELVDQMNNCKISDNLDRLLINTCRKMLKQETDSFEFNPAKTYPFFIAGMFSAFNNPLAQMLAPYEFTHIKFHSQALNTALLLQYHSL